MGVVTWGSSGNQPWRRRTGDQLAELMIEHGLGVKTTKTYEIGEVSNDFLVKSEP